MAFVVLASMLGNTAHAHSPATADQPAATKTKKTAAKKEPAKKAVNTVGKAKFIRGSEESIAERNARLKRECKGGVNAGACAGFTR